MDSKYTSAKFKTGEELDEALEAALKAKEYYDIAIKNASAPNLLDNWYFADPIGQRGGWVVLPNTPYYAASGTTYVGNTTAYLKASYKTGEDWGTVEIGGTVYSVWKDYIVRGYVGAGYTIDRWKITGASSVLKNVNGGITFTPTAASNGVRQDIESPKSFAGKEVTLSFLLGTANGVKARAGFGDGSNHFGEWSTSEIITYTGVVANDATTLTAFIQLDTVAESPLIIAAKLELGSTQTLARQDENGNWVLNDPPPNKALELAKCQRYQLMINDIACVSGFLTNSRGHLRLQISTPTSMRAVPTISQMVITGVRTTAGSNTTPNITEVYADTVSSIGVQIVAVTDTFATDPYVNNTPISCYLKSAFLDANL